jgi:hypothetical protein
MGRQLTWMGGTKDRLEQLEKDVRRLDSEREMHYRWIREREATMRSIDRELEVLQTDLALLLDRLDLEVKDEPARRVIEKVVK